MKRISFISPVEAVRGNLSGKRQLTYAPDNNSAWGVTSSERQYANNYVPRFIGAQRSKDGKTYFAVKTKSAVKMSAAMRLQNAMLSASSVVANSIMADLSTFTALQRMFIGSYEFYQKWSFKRWIMAAVRTGLSEKNDIFFNAAGEPSIIFQNPYKKSHVPTAIALPDYPIELIVKFWTQLADNPITFKVAGQTGIAHDGDTFHDVVEKNYNVLGLTSEVISELGTMIKLGDMYVTREVEDAPVTVQDIDEVDENENYFLDSEYHTAG